MRIVIVILTVLILGVQFRLWVGERGIAGVWGLKQSIAEAREQNAHLTLRNKRWEAEVLDLKDGLAEVEERARRELGFVRKGETFFLVIKD